ncbi:hypothetical protein J6590_025507 [Homalodisca vitripennis]|nr:hypothetical protein J6590_027522 [Homalodisca vitripennis]KAG8278188.1 hypothetical protein J6590_025507 [Homalodisca vitripennis]
MRVEKPSISLTLGTEGLKETSEANNGRVGKPFADGIAQRSPIQGAPTLEVALSCDDLLTCWTISMAVLKEFIVFDQRAAVEAAVNLNEFLTESESVS